MSANTALLYLALAVLRKSRSGIWGKGGLGRLCRKPGWLSPPEKPKGGWSSGCGWRAGTGLHITVQAFTT